MDNTLMLVDSYKLSHYSQYPKDMTAMQCYLEARKSPYKRIVFFGLEYLIQKYMFEPVTGYDLADAKHFATQNGMPFNEEGFTKLAELGYWPVKITAKPEGSLCQAGETLLTIESTDPKLPWVASFLETMLMKVWYPSTVASKALHVRKILEIWYDKTGASMAAIDFAYLNFGDRSGTSVESSAISGAAHLTSFSGTDSFASLKLLDDTYLLSESAIGLSVPASEHSTVTTWGKDNEFAMIESFLEANKGQEVIACVLDSYNIYNAVEFVTTHLRTRIESGDYPSFVIRPDSGNPLDIIPTLFSIMETNKVEYSTHTAKGKDYKLFTSYRILWSDSISPEVIDEILNLVVALGYSPANLMFGSGTDLVQNVSRDTCGFAFKCCAIQKGSEEWLPVYKDPMHDGFKKSKGGYKEIEDGYVYYNNGYTHSGTTFNAIRKLIKRGV